MFCGGQLEYRGHCERLRADGRQVYNNLDSTDSFFSTAYGGKGRAQHNGRNLTGSLVLT